MQQNNNNGGCNLQVAGYKIPMLRTVRSHQYWLSGTQELVVDQNTLLGRLEPKN